MTLPINWIRADKYCDESGEPYSAVESRIKEGIWAAGRHYKRIGPRTLFVNLEAVNEWMDQQPHVEALAFPKGSKSGKASAAHASA